MCTSTLRSFVPYSSAFPDAIPFLLVLIVILVMKSPASDKTLEVIADGIPVESLKVNELLPSYVMLRSFIKIVNSF